MTDEFKLMNVLSDLLEKLGDRSIEPFAELRRLLDACGGCEPSELDPWLEKHAATTSLDHLWAQCGDARLLLMVRGLSARSDSPENAWRRIAVVLCASARALAAAVPPEHEGALRVLEAAEGWTRGACSLAHLRETYDSNCFGLIEGDGHGDPTIYNDYDDALDVVTGPLEEAPLDERVHRVALRLMVLHSICCVDAIADHECGTSSLPHLRSPAVSAMFFAASAAYFAHFLDLLPASRQAPWRDRCRAVTQAAGTVMGGIEIRRLASAYAVRARLADALRAQVLCPRLQDVLAD